MKTHSKKKEKKRSINCFKFEVFYFNGVVCPLNKEFALNLIPTKSGAIFFEDCKLTLSN